MTESKAVASEADERRAIAERDTNRQMVLDYAARPPSAPRRGTTSLGAGVLEYHAHAAALRELRTSIDSAFADDPSVAARVDDLCAAVDADPDAALLGACLDQIVAHAAADGAELQLLEDAADLWSRGRALYDELTLTRQEIESALVDPTSPGALGKLQSGIGRLDGLRTGVLEITGEAATLKQAIEPMPHLDRHPRQEDIRDDDWGWRDVFLARRTDAFVREVFAAAATPRTHALAFGVLSGYAANVAGSAYLGCVTGGPRRLHRFRDRLARNTVGAAVRDSFSTPTATDLSQQLTFVGAGGVPQLPSEIATVLSEALSRAFPTRSQPDLDLGLRRAVRHLELLDSFQRPPLPDPPAPGLPQADGGLTILTLDEYDVPTPGGTVGGGGIGSAPDPSPTEPDKADSKKASGDLCLAILLIAITLGIALLIYCIGKWSTDEECEVSDFFDELGGSEEPDPREPTAVGQQELTAMAKPQAAGHVAQELFNLQVLLWQGFDAALSYLAVTGLVYPDDLLLTSPLYQQFLTTPVRQSWPQREDGSAEERYHQDPSSPVELPAGQPPFPPGHPPASFIVPWSSGHDAAAPAVTLLGQILRDDLDTTNFDLDADRGFRHACWDVAPGTSIADPTLSVAILGYDEE